LVDYIFFCGLIKGEKNMGKLSYNSCCRDKIHHYIYKNKNFEYNFVECCNHVYYLFPHHLEEKNFFLIREKSDSNYFYMDTEKHIHPVFSVEIEKEEREEIIKSKLLPILEHSATLFNEEGEPFFDEDVPDNTESEEPDEIDSDESPNNEEDLSDEIEEKRIEDFE